MIVRLEKRSSRTGLNKSRLAERYLDEGLRMDDHPGIVFRDGPSGRRAGLAGGPDVWEVVAAIRASGLAAEQAVETVSEWGSLTERQVRIAAGYYADYPDEIDERIRAHLEEADEAEARWERQLHALG